MNLTVRKDVLEAARQYIPNLSQFLEDRLLEFLRWVYHPLASSQEWARREQILNLLLEGPKTAKEITSKMNVPKTTCYEILKELEKTGW